MPKVPELAEAPIQSADESQSSDRSPIQAFTHFGVDLRNAGGQACGECPFCGKDSKFYVSLETGKWDCKSCSRTGNPLTFIRTLWEESDKATTDYGDLAADRGFLFPESLITWGMAKSIVTGEWLVPEYGVDGKICCLSKYSMGPKGKRILWACPAVAGISHGLFGMGAYKSGASEVWVVEGPWDGVALWEVLRMTRRDEDGSLTMTGAERSSILADASILATPGINTFKDAWVPLFTGKRVIMCYDNDHPRTSQDGREVGLQSFRALKRIAGIFSRAEFQAQPQELQYLKWGEDGHDPSLPDGYDIRDLLKRGKTPTARIDLVPEILGRISDIPTDWGAVAATAKKTENTIEILPCSSWKTLQGQWNKALSWHGGLEYGLSMMLTSVCSTLSLCDQLWLQVISPPSTGKTELVTGILTNKKHAIELGTFTGLHSGYQTDREGKEDHSTIARVKNKTFVVKDGDVILRASNREKLLAQIRDAYDTYCSTSYGNAVKNRYEDHRFTFLLLGTESMLELDAAELGARFLNVVILDKIEQKMEEQINLKGFEQIVANRGKQANGVAGSGVNPNLLLARQLTAGYVDHLRDNGAGLREACKAPGTDVGMILSHLARFVCMLRARPAKKQAEVESREMSRRVMGQLTAATLNLPVVLGKNEVDDEVLRMIARCAHDTARGKAHDLANLLHRCKAEGAPTESLAIWTNETAEKTSRLLRFMASPKIGVVERFKPVATSNRTPRWRLTPAFQSLYREVLSAKGS